MGDSKPNNPNRPQEYDGYHHDETSRTPAGSGMPDGAPFHSQFPGLSQQQRPDIPRQQPQQSQHGLASYGMSSQHAHAGPFNLGSMAGALPEYAGSQQTMRLPPGVSSTLRGPQYSSGSPFGGHHVSGQYPGQAPVETSFESTSGQQAQRLAHLGAGQASFSPYGQHMPQYYYPPNTQFAPQAQQSFFLGGDQNVAMYGGRPGGGTGQGGQVDYGAKLYGQALGRTVPGAGNHGDLYAGSEAGFQRPSSSGGSMGSVPRGPPRKPKQSGHALWVGNLPPTTTVLDLKDHFSRDATRDIESLFLISKSNCAFVNYRTEESCAAAMQRFHDSRFQNVRLVCRLRRGSAPPVGVPSGPSAMSKTPPASSSKPSSSEDQPPAEEETAAQPGSGLETSDGVEQKAQETARDRYFIVKSLTLQDLNLSVRNGIWATQSHNEETLNKAYESAENVYLIFSANKSGEYFGYARMTSPIAEDAQQVLGTIPRHEPTPESADALRTIPTPATEFAPKGHIIDDSARGTIFWEADHSDEEPEEETKPAADGVAAADEEGPSGPQSWGKPFRIEWLSTNRLPFYRTRGLRNPWNSNREVKIARDGTELEPGVGSRLVQMFHRMGQPPGGPHGVQGAVLPGMPSPMGGGGGGVPSMRPY